MTFYFFIWFTIIHYHKELCTLWNWCVWLGQCSVLVCPFSGYIRILMHQSRRKSQITPSWNFSSKMDAMIDILQKVSRFSLQNPPLAWEILPQETWCQYNLISDLKWNVPLPHGIFRVTGYIVRELWECLTHIFVVHISVQGRGGKSTSLLSSHRFCLEGWIHALRRESKMVFVQSWLRNMSAQTWVTS